MFEDSLVESRVGHISASKQRTAFVAVGLQCALAAVVIALPLLHPEALPFQVGAPRALMPLLPKPPVRVQRVESSAASSSVAAPAAMRPPMLPSLLPSLGTPAADAPSIASVHFGDGMGSGIPDVLAAGDGRGSRVSVAPTRETAPVRVSGILQGLLLTPIRPVYPAIARTAGVQGTVVVDAIISRTGTIESLHVVSGPVMLQGAAVEAIRDARYRPYRLNGEPIAVQTTITVNFRMGG